MRRRVDEWGAFSGFVGECRGVRDEIGRLVGVFIFDSWTSGRDYLGDERVEQGSVV